MIAGTLLSDRQFLCKDGSVQDKIIVVLTDGQSGHYVVAKTTSKGHLYGINFGCQPMDRFPSFFLPRGSCCLALDTWVQLEGFYEFDAYDLERKIVDTRIFQIGRLDDHIEALLICSINSDDISTYQERLLQSALAENRKSRPASAG